jgi:competence transcription factor ComK
MSLNWQSSIKNISSQIIGYTQDMKAETRVNHHPPTLQAKLWRFFLFENHRTCDEECSASKTLFLKWRDLSSK